MFFDDVVRMDVTAARSFCIIGGLMLLAGVCAGSITLDPNPGTFYIGDQVKISGHLEDSKSIAVFLFVTGEGLDPAGVTMENLKLRAGTGHFSSAFVHPDGRFTFEWDTAFSVGPLTPGTYRIYVVDVPLNLNRLTDTDELSVAVLNVTFQKHPSTEIPLGWAVPPAALGWVAGILFLNRREHH